MPTTSLVATSLKSAFILALLGPLPIKLFTSLTGSPRIKISKQLLSIKSVSFHRPVIHYLQSSNNIRNLQYTMWRFLNTLLYFGLQDLIQDACWYRLHMNAISISPALFSAPDNRSGQMTCSSVALIQHCLQSQVWDGLETFFLSFITCSINSRYRLHMNTISTAPALFTAPDNRSGQMACSSLSLIQHCLWSQVWDDLETFYLSFITCLFNSRYRLHNERNINCTSSFHCAG